MAALFGNVLQFTWQQLVMEAIGGILIWLAIKKDMEPTLLLPIGFGAMLVNLPMSGAVTQIIEDTTAEEGVIDTLFNFVSPTSCSLWFCSSASAP
jgi:oxaloacetate decarboxylase beta subunit